MVIYAGQVEAHAPEMFWRARLAVRKKWAQKLNLRGRLKNAAAGRGTQGGYVAVIGATNLYLIGFLWGCNVK